MKKTCVSHKPGDIVQLAGIDFAVLRVDGPETSDSQEQTLFIVAVNSQGDSKFGRTNNYNGSDLADAVCDWLDGLEEKGVDLGLIKPRTIDLMTLDGYKGFGSIEVKVAPLTMDEARRYAEYIPNCDDVFWLATGYGGPEHFGAAFALLVYSSGNWGSNYCSSSYGIRPALVISSSLLASDEDEDKKPEESVPLSAVPTDDLIAELRRRIPEGSC